MSIRFINFQVVTPRFSVKISEFYLKTLPRLRWGEGLDEIGVGRIVSIGSTGVEKLDFLSALNGYGRAAHHYKRG